MAGGPSGGRGATALFGGALGQDPVQPGLLGLHRGEALLLGRELAGDRLGLGGLLHGEGVERRLGLHGGVASGLGPRQGGLGLLLLLGRVGAQGGEVVLERGEAGLLGGEPVHRLALHVHHGVDEGDPVGELLGVGARQGHVELAEALLLVDLGGELGHPGAAARDRLGRGAELVLGLLLAGLRGLELLRGDRVRPVGGGGGVLRLLEHGAARPAACSGWSAARCRRPRGRSWSRRAGS